MKKTIGLIIAACLCLVLGACGEGNNKNSNAVVVGEWKDITTGIAYSFKEDGSCVGTSVDKENNYKYEVKSDLELLLLYSTQVNCFNIVEEDGITKLVCGNNTFVKEENYESYRTKFVADKRESLTSGKTLLEIGKTYTCGNEQKFTVNSMEVSEVNSGTTKLNVQITPASEDWYLYTSSVRYAIPTVNGSAGMAEEKQDDGTYLLTLEMNASMAKVKAALEEYAIVSFTLEGTEFYIDLKNVTIK